MKKIIKYTIYGISLILVTLFLIGLINKNSFKRGSLEFTSSWQGEIIDLGDEKIRCLQKGNGKDVLLIHGTPGSIEDWQPIIDDLSKDYRVTAFDRPGNGFSTANNYNYTLRSNVVIANKLINQLKLDSVVVVGHSYGGSIVAQMGTSKNDNVKSYIIVASPLYQFKPESIYKLINTPIIDKGLTVLINKTVAPQKIKEGIINSFAGKEDIANPDFINIRTQLWTQPKVLYATSKVRMNYSDDLNKISSKYKLIDKRISVFVGSNDNSLIIEDFHTLKNDLPNGEFHYLENTAHFIQLERSNILLKIIKDHLNN